MKITIPYHKTHLQADIPDNQINGIFTSRIPDPTCPESQNVTAALDNPIGSPRLEELSKNKTSAVVITSDHTRPVPSKIIMPQILERLRSGNPDIDITILVATGFHRGTTKQELIDKLGAEIVENETIVVHDSADDSMLVEAGTLPSGGKLIINKLAMECDLLVGEGFIEPHFFAGFSGGRKSVLPGVVSRETVLANHCSEFIQSPFARTGNLENNPLHTDMLYAAGKADLAFIVNVVINHKKQVIHTVAGDYIKAHQAGCDYLKEICQIEAPDSDIIITSNGGYPLDQNVYQAVKGMTAAEAICKENGVIIMVASCSDGHGGQSFYESLKNAASPKYLWDSLLNIPRNQTQPDQWEFQILARILMHHSVIVVTTHADHEMLQDMHLKTATTIEEALELAKSILSDNINPKIAVIPDGVSVIARKKKD